MTGLATAVTVLVVALLVLAARAALGLDRGPWMALYVGTSPVVLQISWVALGIGIWLSIWWLTIPSAALAAVAVRDWWRATKPGQVQPDAPGRSIRIVTANLYFANENAHEAWPVIAAYNPDIVVLQEISRHSGQWIPPEGWHCERIVREDAFGTAILTRIPPAACEPVDLAGIPQLRVVMSYGNQTLTVYCVHPVAPTTSSSDLLWRKQFDALTEVVGAEPDGPLVVAGDFNATPLHRPFQTLLRRTGLSDARPSSRRLAATWPSGGLDSPPLIRRAMALDHVLVRGVALRSATVLPATNADHLPLGVEIVLAGRV